MPQRTRRRFDDDNYEPDPIHRARSSARTHDFAADADGESDGDEPSWSTYADSSHGPAPLPAWVIASPAAIDDDLGVLKSGKEADVSLVRRSHGEQSVLMAVKRYRDAQHRLFHRDSGYLEGRRVRKSREMRAIETRTAFGREVIAQQWAIAEFHVLSTLWSAGAAVPYPVQLHGNELMMEFLGTPDGTAAPRLAQLRPTPTEAADLFGQLRTALLVLADQGYTHGDLSAYNLLVHDGRLMLIDLPQAVDLVGNPQGFQFLSRDCENICAWFSARGIDADPAALRRDLLRVVPGTTP